MAVRPALGQNVRLGMLYDARRDDVLVESPLDESLIPQSATLKEIINGAELFLESNDSFEIKCRNLAIDNAMRTSLLVGLNNAEGSGSYFYKESSERNVVKADIYHKICTIRRRIDFGNSDMQALFRTGAASIQATHVVTEITYGATTIFSAEHPLRKGEQKEVFESLIHTKFDQIRAMIAERSAGNPVIPITNDADGVFQVQVYSDIYPRDGFVPNSLSDAAIFIYKMPEYLLNTNTGFGIPLSYTITDFNVLRKLFGAPNMGTISYVQPSQECFHKFNVVVHNFREEQKSLLRYHAYVMDNSFCVPADHSADLRTHIEKLRNGEHDLKSQFRSLLLEVRTKQADVNHLDRLIEKFQGGDFAPNITAALLNAYTSKIQFARWINDSGARYFSQHSNEVARTIQQNSRGETYVLYYNTTLINANSSWQENVALLRHVLGGNLSGTMVLAVDNFMTDNQGKPLTAPRVEHYRGTQLITKDVNHLQKFLAGHSIATFSRDKLEHINEKPVQRRAIKVPCPSKRCGEDVHKWICSICYASLDFGYIDKYIYCDCGRCKFDKWNFRCSNPAHGSNWTSYDPTLLMHLLQRLEPYESVNILILGETGVGKSTFINAFLNYLSHDSLEKALEPGPIDHVVPCSFSTQVVDKDDPKGRFLQKHVQVGYSPDEIDGSAGQSATQKTQVYAIFRGEIVLRLIDTPGIADVRGVAQDELNMDDVLTTLRGVDKLHGILILLKPNSSRLGVMFNFCVKELLLHLHKDAARNLIFGFTNTRGSNYTPGDTFKPLEALLDTYKNNQGFEIGLYHDNVYCFDSESFRYLAARKQNLDMGRFEESAQSWKYSNTEAQRLMNHVRSIVPHQVTNMVNLHATRHLIKALVKPMAEISQAIKASIKLNEDNKNEIANRRLNEKDLRSRLHVQQQVLKVKDVDKPITVCTEEKCIEQRDAGADYNGRLMKTVYKSLCHNPCYLTGVPVERAGTSSIARCAAFECGKTEKCKLCGHHWMSHLHIMYEISTEMAMMPNKTVNELLQTEGGLIKAVEKDIEIKNKVIKEYEFEYDQIQQAAARFSIFLRDNGIGFYNDAMLDYLDHLIKEERAKVRAGGHTVRLEELQKSRAEYETLIDAFTRNITIGASTKPLDAEGVHATVKSLYALSHFGQNLARVCKDIQTTHEATYRETTYDVRRSTPWSSGFGVLSSPGSFMMNVMTKGVRSALRSNSLAYRSMRSDQEKQVVEDATATRQSEATQAAIMQAKSVLYTAEPESMQQDMTNLYNPVLNQLSRSRRRSLLNSTKTMVKTMGKGIGLK